MANEIITPLIPNYLRKFGRNPDVDASVTNPVDIAPHGAGTTPFVQYIPSAPIAFGDIDIVSDSADDDVGGTGAETVHIEGVGDNGLLVAETVDLDGITPVNPQQNYRTIHRAYVTSAGSGGENAGTITMSDATGTFASINPGKNQTEQCFYLVPNNFKNAYLYDIRAEMPPAGGATSWLEIELAINLASYGLWQVKATGYASLGAEFRIQTEDDPQVVREHAIQKLGPGDIIKLRVSDASGLNLPVVGGFRMILDTTIN